MPARRKIKREPEAGTRIQPTKNQGYTIPIYLYQELVSEASRRRRLGLSHGSQNSIAVAALTSWLEENKGGE